MRLLWATRDPEYGNGCKDDSSSVVARVLGANEDRDDEDAVMI